MIKTIVYDEDKIIGVNPTKISKIFLDDVYEDGDFENPVSTLVIVFDDDNCDDVFIPNVDFAFAHEIIDFLNNPEEMVYTLE